jgi:pentatricopeptide repeat protein
MSFLLSELIHSCHKCNDPRSAAPLFDDVQRLSLPLDQFIFRRFLQVLAPIADSITGLKILTKIKENKLNFRADVIDYTNLIRIFSSDTDQAIAVYNLAKENGVKLDSTLFTTLCKSCFNLKTAKWIHKEILKQNIYMTPHLRNTLMSMYSRCGSLTDSYQVFLDGFPNDIIHWNTLMLAHRSNGDPKGALTLYQQLKRSRTHLSFRTQ